MEEYIKELITKSKSNMIKNNSKDVIKIVDLVLDEVKKHRYLFIDEITDIYIPFTEISNLINIKNIIKNEPGAFKRIITSCIYKLTKYTMRVKFELNDDNLYVMLVILYTDIDKRML